MATYATDLTDITDAESGVVVEPSAPYDGGINGALSTDLFIQNTSGFAQEGKNAVGDQTNGVGMLYNNGSTTFATGEVVLGWGYFAFPTTLYSSSSNGWSFLIGSSISAIDAFTLGGDDVAPHPYGGWYNYAIDPTVTSSVLIGGGNGGTYAYFGFGAFLRAKLSKGDCMAMDAIRYGRAEIYCTGTACTFIGMAAENDTILNRWGLFQDVGGSYLWKGLMSMGQAGTSATFSDSNKTIAIANMAFVTSTFNKIEVNNVSTDITWTNITFNSLSTISPGQLEVIDNATVLLDSCIFNNMDSFQLQSQTTGSTTTWNVCNYVVQSGSTIEGCIFSSMSGATALYVDDLDNITSCNFTSDGTGHAMELDSNHAGNAYTLTDFTYDGYASISGTTGNEVLYNNSGGHVQLTVDGGDTPTYRNGTAATTEFVTSIILSFSVIDSDGNPISGATAYIDNDNAPPFIMNKITNASGIASVTWTGGAVADATWRVRLYGYKPYLATVSVPASGTLNLPVTLVTDLQQQI